MKLHPFKDKRSIEKRWEQLVVSKLKWELSAVTPGDFLMHILSRLPVPRTWDPVMVRRHAQTFIALSARVLGLESLYLEILGFGNHRVFWSLFFS
ncbi:hypothetical protein K0M31_018396 [Melipona bicolor]|uniref:Uncharacterized protein n=1 Tax=Melipona bicolor TaxID=60889 RepID=A0AA40G3D5_9HYME|nr:hypothetical protein K0M31_018396 [Melipona bicolor]